MVPRVLGQYLPDSVRRQVPYVDSRVSCVAEDFTPFGHFHVLGQKHMRTTLMHSNGSTEDSHVLRLNHHEETILAPLITANSLKGVLLLGHDMTGYIKEVTAILECCSACSFERGGAEYQATLCHQGEFWMNGFSHLIERLAVPVMIFLHMQAVELALKQVLL